MPPKKGKGKGKGKGDSGELDESKVKYGQFIAGVRQIEGGDMSVIPTE
jgi:hypothetical protein